MLIDGVWLIGFIASIFITISFLPQVYKMWKIRYAKLEEFHILWFVFSIIGSFLFMWYGFFIEQIGLIILNTVGVFSSVLMLFIYLGVWRREEEEIERLCAVCGKLIKITIKPDLSYDGGHYFGKIVPFDAEYWECDECFNKVEE